MEELPSNSQNKNPPSEEKKVAQIASGTRRKKSLGKRFTETFVKGDLNSVVDYVLWDVLVPAAKDMFSDAMSQGTDRMLYGESRRQRGRAPTGLSSAGSGYFNYQGISSGKRPDPRTQQSSLTRRSRSVSEFDDIFIETRAQGEEIIDQMFILIEKYDQCTVSDLYEMVGITASHTDVKWGWQTLPGAKVGRVKGGYFLDLPKPEQLD